MNRTWLASGVALVALLTTGAVNATVYTIDTTGHVADAAPFFRDPFGSVSILGGSTYHETASIDTLATPTPLPGGGYTIQGGGLVNGVPQPPLPPARVSITISMNSTLGAVTHSFSGTTTNYDVLQSGTKQLPFMQLSVETPSFSFFSYTPHPNEGLLNTISRSAGLLSGFLSMAPGPATFTALPSTPTLADLVGCAGADLVNCPVHVGIALNSRGGEGVTGGLVPKLGYTMDQVVAVAKGEIANFDHFNWEQDVEKIIYPSNAAIDATYTPQAALDVKAAILNDQIRGFGSVYPGVDPALGGNPGTTCVGDNLPGMWDESPKFCIQLDGSVKSNKGFTLADNTRPTALLYADYPAQLPGVTLEFHTSLIGVSTTGKAIPLNVPFTSFNWGYIEPLGGPGGTGIADLTSINPFPDLGGFGTVSDLHLTDVPEPASLAVLGMGIFGLAMVRRSSNVLLVRSAANSTGSASAAYSSALGVG